MKKGLLFIIIALVIALLVKAYLPRADETKTVMDFDQANIEDLSDDTSFSTIEKELNETEILEFEQELEAVDKDINQL